METPFSIKDLLIQFSAALDAVEKELTCSGLYHTKRVAVLSLLMGKRLGLSKEALFCLGGCALLHDNALKEYLASEAAGEENLIILKQHCILGQWCVDLLPFPLPVKEVLLYHHEHADGSGPFQMKAGQFPEAAALIALADLLDTKFHQAHLTPEGRDEIRWFVKSVAGTTFETRYADCALAVLDDDYFDSIADSKVTDTVHRLLPEYDAVLDDRQVVNLGSAAARIIDYKSKVTGQHSSQLATKAWMMGGYYGLADRETALLYLSAALHDIGKLYIPVDLLEKPGVLTGEEYHLVMSHVRFTAEVLSKVHGLDSVAEPAANHHEKLDGSGYPRGLMGAQLGFESRLLACLDIYQALREDRSYHRGKNHWDAMTLLYTLARAGQLDMQLVRDIDEAFGTFGDRAVSPPSIADFTF